MRKETPHITAAELRILKVVWQLGSGTVRQILDALPADEGSPPAYTTVMTMMKQLAEKGLSTWIASDSRSCTRRSCDAIRFSASG